MNGLPSHETDVCIVGGGPAGLVCGLLLAQIGIRTLVLEKHPDFEREYRGEVLMPRFIQAMKQVGLFDFLLGYPHLKLQGFELYVKNRPVVEIGVSTISPDVPFILWMPQTLMLNALHERAKTYPPFTLWFDAAMTDFIYEDGRVAGIRATREGKPVEVRAKITLGADGRASTARHKGHFEMAYEDHDFDVIWFTIPKPAGYDDKVRAFFSARHNYLALPKYPDKVQCGIIVETGGYAKYRSDGIDSLRAELLSAHPLLHEFARGLRDFSPFTVLVAKADRVKDWARDGLLLIGDAAHTCSPAAAVGVSVAVATAIVAADVVADAVESGDYSKKRLDRVQALREKEVEEIQAIQNRAAAIIDARGPFGKALALATLILLAKTRLFAKIQRRLMVASKPLPVRRWQGL